MGTTPHAFHPIASHPISNFAHRPLASTFLMTTILSEETIKKVIRQVEYYFSDSNLPKDTFLKKTVDESEDGMVSLALICTFSRMRGHLGLGDVKVEDISEETVKLVANTLKSATSLKISEDGMKVGRATELINPEEVIEQVNSRTVAAAPFPYDAKAEDLESFFSQLAKVNSIRLPKHIAEKRVFSGTALIEFSSEEEAENVLKQSLTYAGVQLELKPKKDFDVERETSAAEFENYQPHVNPKSKNNPSAEENYPKGLILAFSLKKSNTLEKDSKANPVAEGFTGGAEEKDVKADEVDKIQADSKSEGLAEEKNGAENEANITEGKDNASNSLVREGEEKKDKEKKDVEKTKASECVNNMDVVMREDLKKVFQKFGTVKFIDFKIGEESGYIRFEDPSGSQKARAAALLAEDGGIAVKNFILALEPLTGDAEKEYWTVLRGNQEKVRDNKGGGRGRGGRFNRGGKNFRSRDNDTGNGRPNKLQRV